MRPSSRIYKLVRHKTVATQFLSSSSILLSLSRFALKTMVGAWDQFYRQDAFSVWSLTSGQQWVARLMQGCPYQVDSVTVSLFAFWLLIWQIRNKNKRTLIVRRAGLSRYYILCIWAIFGILVSTDCASGLFLGGCQVPALDKSAKVVRKKRKCTHFVQIAHSLGNSMILSGKLRTLLLRPPSLSLHAIHVWHFK